MTKFDAEAKNSVRSDGVFAGPVEQLETKNKGGAGQHMTPAEKREVRVAYLTEQITVTQLAARHGRTRETIRDCLKGSDFAAIQHEVNVESAKLAVGRLHASVEEAADAWVDSLSIAGRKGDHRPSRDLLLHTGAILPVGNDSGPRVIVQIGVADSDVSVTVVSTDHVKTGT